MTIQELALQRLNEYRSFVDTSNVIASEKLSRVTDLLSLLPDDERFEFGRKNGMAFPDQPKDTNEGSES